MSDPQRGVVRQRMSPGNCPSPGNCSNRLSGIAQLFLGRMGSDFGEILYMREIFSPSRQEPMRVATGIISEKYMVGQRRYCMYRRGLEGLVVATIISFTW